VPPGQVPAARATAPAGSSLLTLPA